jgi:hypothetical protein
MVDGAIFTTWEWPLVRTVFRYVQLLVRKRIWVRTVFRYVQLTWAVDLEFSMNGEIESRVRKETKLSETLRPMCSACVIDKICVP